MNVGVARLGNQTLDLLAVRRVVEHGASLPSPVSCRASQVTGMKIQTTVEPCAAGCVQTKTSLRPEEGGRNQSRTTESQSELTTTSNLRIQQIKSSSHEASERGRVRSPRTEGVPGPPEGRRVHVGVGGVLGDVDSAW